MAKCGVFILSYPVLEDPTGIYFGDECYRYTVEQCQPYIDEVFIVARHRKVPEVSGKRSLMKDVNARLMLELPDFGIGGQAGWLNIFRLLFTRKLKVSLYRLMQESDLIYVEAPSLEAYLAAVSARQVGRPLIMEMRGEALLNRHYMKERFGRKGMAYTWFLRRLFGIVRKQAIAGLYINQSLLERYPVAGQYQEVISDVRLPDHIFGEPRHIATPARRFLYVGSLEKIKQIDLILSALHRIKDQFSSDWMFHIVGDGPEMKTLVEITERLGIRSRVSFHGRVPWGEPLFKLYKECDLLLMASTSEGASRTLIEAMAFGLPSISTEVGAAPELLDPKVLVEVGNEVKYAQKLLYVATNPDFMTHLSKRNWERAQYFRLSNLKGQRQAFYAKAIELSSRSRKTDILHP